MNAQQLRFKKVGVIGSGTMGIGIAEFFARKHIPVLLYDISIEFLERAIEGLKGRLQREVNKGRLDESQLEHVLKNICPVASLDALAETDLVIEAAVELLEVKQELFAQLDRITFPDTILASNTSSLSISTIAAATKRPHRVIGLHFFNPAPRMPLVEVIAGMESDRDGMNAVMEWMRSLGKEAVLVKDSPGFLVNRVARPFHLEAYRVLSDEGVDKQQVDRIMQAAGFKMGPFQLQDLIGIDINYLASKAVFEAYHGEPRFRPHAHQRAMVECGFLGRKTGKGHYEYA